MPTSATTSRSLLRPHPELPHDAHVSRRTAPLLAAAAIVAIVVAAGLAVWVVSARGRRAPPPPEVTATVPLLAPLGSVASPPRAFTWTPVPGTASYKVTIGDDDALWPIFVRTTRDSALPLDERDASAIVAGRIHAWEVLALDASGVPVARGTGRFRIRLPGEDASTEPLF